MKFIHKYLGWVFAPVLAASSAHGLTLTEMSASIDACHAPAADISQTTDALVGQGWVMVEGDLPSDIVELLIWPQVAFYITGDSGGEQIPALVDLQRKTVAGFARKADIDSSKTRILRRQIGADHEAVLVFWLQPDPAQTQVICRFALSPHSLVGHTPEFFAAPTVAEIAPGRSFSVIPMNPARLSAEIDAPVTVSGTLQTSSTFGVTE